MASKGGKTVRLQSFRTRVFWIMGNRCLYIIECFHMISTPGFERLKVTALNLFRPTASPPFPALGFFILRHSLLGEKVGVTWVL